MPPALTAILLMFALTIPAFAARQFLFKRPIGRGISIALCGGYLVVLLTVFVLLKIRNAESSMGSAAVISYYFLTGRPKWLKTSAAARRG